MLNRITQAERASILRAAAALIDRGFTKGTSARDQDGYSTLSTNPDACRWCASGAIEAATLAWIERNTVATTKRETTGLVVLFREELASDVVALNGLQKRVVEESRIDNTWTLILWNDHPDRRDGEVAALLRETADSIEKEAA